LAEQLMMRVSVRSGNVAPLATCPASEQAEMAVIGVLAHAHVGNNKEIWKLELDRSHTFLHRTMFVPRRRSGRILYIGVTE